MRRKCKYYLVGGSDIKNEDTVLSEDNCNFYNNDPNIEKYMKDSLFNMNKTTLISIKKNEDMLIDYKIPNKKMFDQIKEMDKNIDKYIELNACRNKKGEVNRQLKYIMNEINIRRNIQVYINKKYNVMITRGFCKMYDILNKFDLIDLTKEEVKTFHACESPGNFINATNSWIKKHDRSFKYNWTGNSLNPLNPETIQKYGNVVPDDYGYIKKYLDRWDFGRDNIGDITNKENLLYWESKYNHSIDLYTSDCGYCERINDFDNDKMLLYLNTSQLILGLLLLKIGGNMVCKIFLPLNKPLMISIIYIYTMYFKKVSFIKQSSGSLSSVEIYIIGMGLEKHLDELTKEKLFELLDVNKFDVNKTLFETFTDHYMSQIVSISNIFMNSMIKYLETLLYYVDNPEPLKNHRHKYFGISKKICAEKWIEENDFKVIDNTLLL